MKYGNHPTIYTGVSDLELFRKFRMSEWEALNEYSKRELLQEICNRSAAAHGEIGSCKVEFSELTSCKAYQAGDRIVMSRELFVNGNHKEVYNGKEVIYKEPCFNMEALLTLLHEEEHAYQSQMIHGDIAAKDPMLLREYRANNHDCVNVPGPDGKIAIGQTYLSCPTGTETGYYVYYVQSTERDAHRLSEARAVAIMNKLAEKYGEEPSFLEFRKSITTDGYQATMMAAKAFFCNDNLETDVNNSLMNHYYGWALPVDPTINAIVEGEMTASFQASIHGSLTGSQGAVSNDVLTQFPNASTNAEAQWVGVDDDGGIM